MSASALAVVSPPSVWRRHPGSFVLTVSAMGLASVANWLFIEAPLGISMAVFFLALSLAVTTMRPVLATRRQVVGAGIALLLGLLPIVEDLNAFSFLIGGLSTVVFAIVLSGGLSRGMRAVVRAVPQLLLAAPFLFLFEIDAVRRRELRSGRVRMGWKSLLGWAMPLAFGVVFLLLFAQANPLLDKLWSQLNFVWILAWLLSEKFAFWIGMFLLSGAFLTFRLQKSKQKLASKLIPLSSNSTLFGEAPVLRSLVLFNLLFTVQTISDVVYLWGGAELPDGMTYAAYAHRGVAQLTAAALLAACFVLAALRPGGAGERSFSIRALVFVWIGQTVLLIVSAIMRLYLYVDVYGLTMLRVTGFVGMGLVAIGLTLIVMRIALQQSNEWLVAANGIALVAVCYACALMNFTAFVANFNTERWLMGERFDAGYFQELGPQAIPALDVAIAKQRLTMDGEPWRLRQLEEIRRDRIDRLEEQMRDWRGWGYRDARLQTYLATYLQRHRDDKGA